MKLGDLIRARERLSMKLLSFIRGDQSSSDQVLKFDQAFIRSPGRTRRLSGGGDRVERLVLKQVDTLGGASSENLRLEQITHGALLSGAACISAMQISHRIIVQLVSSHL